MDTKWFKQQQKRVGVTAEDIAHEMGRARSNVSHILNGHQQMSLPWAEAFAKVLQVDIGTILEKAGVARGQTRAQLSPGFAESDVIQFLGQDRQARSIAAVLGLDRPGVDIWQAKSRSMALGGILPGDYLLVDTHAAERTGQGDIVVAQVYDNARGTASTVIRRHEPPVLVAASIDPRDNRVHVVDGSNVVIKGKVAASWRV
jgi:SOS-response transcriptional repressor LexA